MIIDERHDLHQNRVASATFSDDLRYRYVLTRTWDHRPPLAVCMLNPSTADAFRIDQTINRVIGFAKSCSHGGIVVVNAFALRSTDPTALYADPSPVSHPRDNNDEQIFQATKGLRLIVAWGTHGRLNDRDLWVLQYLKSRRSEPIECFKLTKGGDPGHPLYLPASCVPMPYIARERLSAA